MVEFLESEKLQVQYVYKTKSKNFNYRNAKANPNAYVIQQRFNKFTAFVKAKYELVAQQSVGLQ